MKCEGIEGLQEAAEEACSVLYQPPFSDCEGLDVSGYMASCVADYCMCFGDDLCTCPSLAKAAKECDGARNWRAYVGACNKE